ncbi:MAG: dTDP-4-dehydrorhamnose reductase [Butyrivibrio sp.]|jgi:dTDP-4-dehydrorhamnose reductase|nr:dTDP-4-dehydrorhamnose reductase [Butyrivibrio sp.]
MKKIIVTGCNGQLGRAVNIELGNQEEYELVNTDVAEGDGIHPLDITSVDAVTAFAREVKPYAIINCAAYTAVDAQEKDVDLSYKINAIGPRNLAIAATETGAKLVHISTDYVFDGNGTRPYIEFDKTGPVSMYGISKLAGEQFVEQFSRNFFTIRTAWLYGDGKNFVKTMMRLSETHDEISVVNDQVGTPTSTAELARAIHGLLSTENYGLFHGTCEGSCSWADFTEEIFRIAGVSTHVNHVTTQQYAQMNPTTAPRPKYSILENYMLKLTGGYTFADWHDAIEQYMKNFILK